MQRAHSLNIQNYIFFDIKAYSNLEYALFAQNQQFCKFFPYFKKKLLTLPTSLRGQGSPYGLSCGH